MPLKDDTEQNKDENNNRHQQDIKEGVQVFTYRCINLIL
jgi:hypothetical protein